MLEGRGLRLRGAGGALALADLTMFAHPGEILVLTGPHGAGKTAVLRVFAGLVRPEAGTVRLDGADLSELDACGRAARGIAYVAEHRRTVDPLSVRDNLLLGAWRRRDRRAVRRALSEWLERFPGLAVRQLRRAADLPPAEHAAVALGRAWLAGPRVLLVDEPFAGADPVIRAGVAAALEAARDAGLVVVYAAHELEDASIASRVHAMAQGRLVSSGSLATVTAAAAALIE